MKVRQMMTGVAVIGCIAATTLTASAQEQNNLNAQAGARGNVNRMEQNAQSYGAARQNEARFNERAGVGRNYAEGRNIGRERPYGRMAAENGYRDRAWNGERREFGREAFERDGRAWRGDRWAYRGAYRDVGATAGGGWQPGYAYSDYTYAPGVNYAYAPGYAYSGGYGPYYDYAPSFGIGIGPVGIGFGPAWGW